MAAIRRRMRRYTEDQTPRRLSAACDGANLSKTDMKECSKPIVRRDESLHEQGVFPSTLNRDHKWTFTTHKHQSWSERSVNVLDLVRQLRGQMVARRRLL